MIHQNHMHCLASNSFCGKQSKASDNSFNSAPQVPFLSRYFSISQPLLVNNVGHCDPFRSHTGILKVWVQNMQTLICLRYYW